MIGSRLGPYEITAKLGEGGMGVVYKARDFHLGREVALKVLPEGFTADPERTARFEREAKVLASLNHPNIAQIHGLEVQGETRALVMELVEGPTLAERLESGPLPLEEALSLARQIAEALEEAHGKGIVHRDLKPQNIKASIEGKVKVLDFGLAKAMDPAGVASGGAGPSSQLAASPTLTLGATVQGMILGTAAYMAPEQAKGSAVDKRADIWAFGVVLFEMLSGQRLFEAPTVPETLAQVLTRPPDLDALPASTPAAIRRLLRRCLERNPRQRLHDIADARIVIEEVVAAQGRGETDAPDRAAAPGVSRRERAAWAVAAICGGVALGLALFSLRHGGGTLTTPRFERLTFAAQFISSARFAADGRTVVFSAAREGSRSELFVRHPEDPQPRTLGAADLQLLAVSSKGELALLTGARYQNHNTYMGTLARMPLAEASPRELLRDVSAADWSPDGSELAIVRQVEGRSRLEYPIGTVLEESSGYLSDVRVSPRGDRIACVPHDFVGDNRGRVVVLDRAGSVVASSPEYWGVLGVAWSADGRELFYSALDVDEGDDYALRSLAMDGTVRAVLSVPAGVIVHDRTPDGRFLVATFTQRGIVHARLAGAEAEREISWLDQSFQPVLSRDGRSLLFGDSSSLSGRLYSVLFRAADGAPPVRLGDGNPTDISPDGASVLAVVMDDPPRLMVYPTGAGEPRDLSVPGFVSYDQHAQFLEDGRRVAYCGNAAGAASRCYVRDLAGDAALAVTPEGTWNGRASPDGTAVVATGVDGRYRIYSDAGTSSELVPGLAADDRVLRFRPDGRSLLVYRPTELPVPVDRLDLATGERSTVWRLAPADRAGLVRIEEVSLSADEGAYAYDFKRKTGDLFAVEGVR